MKRTALVLSLVAGLGGAPWVGAQVSAQMGTKDVGVVMLSDIHFDPLHDPAKVARLAEAPVAEWEAILAEPDSPRQAADYEAMQLSCDARGNDPDNALFNSTLKAARERAPHAQFVTVTGDLLVHSFGCRYHAMTHGKAEPGTGTKIIEKTVEYVMRRVEKAFPSVPVYFALGNNDSSCGDYKMNLHDRFFAATSSAVMNGLRGASAAEVAAADETFRAGGYFAVTMGGGMERTRLLVLNDIYNSSLYGACTTDGAKDAAANELKWLNTELGAAEQRGEKIWVIGHIPPGPDAFNTLKHIRSMCTRPPTMFLADDALTDTLVAHAAVIKLAVFAHTHLDEMKLLERTGKAGGVAVKLVPSVSAINGNEPAFTVAKVDPATALLDDYEVYDLTGGDVAKGAWAKEYAFGATYHQPNFSAKTVRTMVEGFQADRAGEKPESQAYMKYFFPGEGSPLFLVWAPYACGFTRDKAEDFKGCICSQ